jgi:hypothetical protein
MRYDLDRLVLPEELERLLESPSRFGISRLNSSAVDRRMFVSFFSFVGFTSMS